MKTKMRNKMRIGVDLDDVLANFVDSLILYYNQTYGRKIQREEILTFSFHNVWGGTLEERVERVNHFFETPYFDNIPLIEDSQEAINYLALSNDLFIVTSRPIFIKEKTEKWLNEFFKGKFLGIVNSSNHYSKAKNSGKTKVQLCNELGISVLIDDSLDYIMQCPSAGIRGILFGDYPWNQNGNLPEGVVRVKNWNEALEELK